MNGAEGELKREKLVRAAVWASIFFGAAFFWSALGALALAWLR